MADRTLKCRERWEMNYFISTPSSSLQSYFSISILICSVNHGMNNSTKFTKFQIDKVGLKLKNNIRKGSCLIKTFSLQLDLQSNKNIKIPPSSLPWEWFASLSAPVSYCLLSLEAVEIGWTREWYLSHLFLLLVEFWLDLTWHFVYEYLTSTFHKVSVRTRMEFWRSWLSLI